MAGLTWVCLCGSTYPAEQARCELDGQTRPEAPLVPRSASVPGQENQSQKSEDGQESRGVSCPGCGRANARDSSHCLRCGDALSEEVGLRTTRLVLPGNVVVPVVDGDVVLLGREATVPSIKAALEGHDQVSRRHADLMVHGSTVRVRDLGSTNGTYANDIAVSPETTIPIGPGLRLRFGKELELVLLPGGAT